MAIRPSVNEPEENLCAEPPIVSPAPNSTTIGGKKSEKAVRALTPKAMVTNTTATIAQP
jgi:hypothetical protein